MGAVGIALAVVVLVAGGLAAIGLSTGDDASSPDGSGTAAAPAASGDGSDGADAPTTGPTTAPDVAEPRDPGAGWADPARSGGPWSSEVPGLLTFRGNPTRSFYGVGPVPENPQVAWSFPADGDGMCGNSPVGGDPTYWCGTGWTGQPAVWEQDGRTWVGFGAYDKAVHFLDADTGERIIGDFDIGDIVKGSITVDPDGFPLVYSGSRADFHVIATDRDPAQSLWSLSAEAVSPTKWNNDWDSSPMVIDDYLFEGGENSQFHIVKLNRAMGPDGRVTVDPELVFNAPGWDDELLAELSGRRANDVSIENSVAVVGDTVYFANSGGLVQGWDLSTLDDGGTPERTFRFWAGDDTDASLVADKEGFLYAGIERERAGTADRAAEVGQLIKLDPSEPEAPLVWSVQDDLGIWATPAIDEGVVYAATDGGRVMAVEQETGAIAWERQLGSKTWQSPVIVDDTLIQGDCDGVLHAYDVSEPGAEPPEVWSLQLPGCIESTPAVWKGSIYVGTRGGQFHAISDP